MGVTEGFHWNGPLLYFEFEGIHLVNVPRYSGGGGREGMGGERKAAEALIVRAWTHKLPGRGYN